MSHEIFIDDNPDKQCLLSETCRKMEHLATVCNPIASDSVYRPEQSGKGHEFLGAGGWCAIIIIIPSLTSYLTQMFYTVFDVMFSLLIFPCVKTILSCSNPQILVFVTV